MNSKEEQGNIQKLSSVINVNKQKKTIEWERPEISSRKSESPRETFHGKIGTVKGRNGMDLIEVEAIRKRWQENTELQEKSLNDLDNHDAVITHLEPDIL